MRGGDGADTHAMHLQSAAHRIATLLRKASHLIPCWDNKHGQAHLETLDGRVMLAADVAVTMIDNLPSFVVPGDKLTLSATVSNQGDAVARGSVTVRFLAPSVDAQDPTGVVATVTRNVNLRPGQTMVFTAKWTATGEASADIHDFGASLTAAEAINESQENDISMVEGGFDLKYLFGSYGDRRNVTFVTADADGTIISYSLRGAGYGEFRAAESEGDVAGLDVIGTGGGSQLIISLKGGDRTANLENNINIAGSLRRFDARNVNFTGSIAVAGSVREFTAGNLTDMDMTVFGGGAAMKFNAGAVTNLRLESATPLASLDVTSWEWITDDTRQDLAENELSTLVAPWIGKLTTRGEFSAVTSLSGAGAPGLTLNTAKIGGVFSGQMAVVGNIGTFGAASMNQGLLVCAGVIARANITLAVDASIWATSLLRLDVGTITSMDVGAGVTFDATSLGGLADGNAQLLGWGSGNLGSISVRGSVGTARFVAGVDPVNGTFLDEDDVNAGLGTIGKIDIKGTATDVLFAGTTFIATAKIGGSSVQTALDDRFIWLEADGSASV